MELTKEEVVGIWAISSNTKYLYEIIELAMYVSYYCDRRLNMDDVALLHKQFLGFGAYCLDH